MSGCNHMKCRCGTQICYICKKTIKNLDHFCRCSKTCHSFTQCSQCGKDCPLQGDYSEYDRIKIERIIHGIDDEVKKKSRWSRLKKLVR